MSIKKLLLAEDDVDDQHLFRSFLEHRQDIDILSIAENGVAVFEILERLDVLPDLILLDQNMPLRTGVQTLQLLKKHSFYRDIPVFMYSTYMDARLQEDSLFNGATAVITKPVTMQGYDEMIDLILGYLK